MKYPKTAEDLSVKNLWSDRIYGPQLRSAARRLKGEKLAKEQAEILKTARAEFKMLTSRKLTWP